MKIHVLLLISLSLFAGESYSKEYKYSDAVNCSPQFQGDIDKATPGEEVEVGLALRKMLHLDLSSKVDTLYHEPNDHPEYKNTKLHYQDWINAYFKSGVKNSVECFLNNYYNEDKIIRFTSDGFSGFIIERKSQPVAYILDHYYVI